MPLITKLRVGEEVIVNGARIIVSATTLGSVELTFMNHADINILHRTAKENPDERKP